MADDKLYWNGKNATQIDTDVICPGDEIPQGVDEKTMSEWKEKNLVSEYCSKKAKAIAEKPDLKKENDDLKKEIAELEKSGDKKLKKENKALKAENDELKREIEELTAPIEGLEV